MKKNLLIFLYIIFFGHPLNAKLNCSKTNFHLPNPKACTTTRAFDPALAKAFKDNNKELTQVIFEILNSRYNNVSGLQFNFPNDSKNVYRSAMLMTSIPCLYELIKERDVAHIIDISSPLSYNTDPWVKIEKKYFFHLVPSPEKSKYIQISDLDYKYTNEEQKKKAFERVATIIRQINSLEGNVLIHCLGGEHKTGIVFGVMQKCLNKMSREDLITEYKCHAAWINDNHPGGFKQENIDFIQEFPCGIIFKK